MHPRRSQGTGAEEYKKPSLLIQDRHSTPNSVRLHLKSMSLFVAPWNLEVNDTYSIQAFQNHQIPPCSMRYYLRLRLDLNMDTAEKAIKAFRRPFFLS